MKRYMFKEVRCPGAMGMGFFEVDGLARPIDLGVVYKGNLPGQPMAEGWFVSSEGVTCPPNDEDGARAAEALMSLASRADKRLRRLLRERLNKAGMPPIEGVIPDPSDLVFTEVELARV